ncbi:MAG: CcmD family protein [Chitinophagaceae bacterium]
MYNYFTRILFIAAFLLLSFTTYAQDKVEMADSMRNNGKIYVVVAVCITILIGLFFYVFILDKKISRFEKNKE